MRIWFDVRPEEEPELPTETPLIVVEPDPLRLTPVRDRVNAGSAVMTG